MSSPFLPQELLDHVVDFLHDREGALRNCCLVSKSWIPCTRKHLFADIKFHSADDLESWKEMFPDPSTSPARHARTLLVACSHTVTAADTEPGGWMTGFSNVVHLEVTSQGTFTNNSMAPLHGLSPVIKSLHVASVTLPPRTFDFILSFPLLEDLTVITYDVDADNDGSSDELSTVVQPSNLPTFTGSLNLVIRGGMGPIVRRLLSLPDGIHFRKLALTWCHEEDVPLTTELVERCSRALECLDIACEPSGEPSPSSIDLSKTTKLEDAVFRPASLENVRWVTSTLETITPAHRNLQQITIYIPYDSQAHFNFFFTSTVGEEKCGQWSNLDRLLVRFWESRSIRPGVAYDTSMVQWGWARAYTEDLLPQIAARGIIDYVEPKA